MRNDPAMAAMLDRAQGVFIIPHYGKGAFVAGGKGGGGVVLMRHGSRWSEPAFYSIGGASVGLQAGGEGGAIAMLLMTQRAVDKFANSQNTWSLNANAGLTIVNYSGKAQGNTGDGDVVVWSNTKGLFGGAAFSVTDITPDARMDAAYYQKQVSPDQILGSTNPTPQASALREALATRSAAR